MFSSSSHLQINGGQFINVTGDMNIQKATPALREDRDKELAELALGSNHGPGRQLLGTDRSGRHSGAARASPYNISQRPQIPTLVPCAAVRDDPLRGATVLDSAPGARSESAHATNSRNSPGPSLDGIITPMCIESGQHSPTRPHLPPRYPPQPDFETSINGGTFITGNVNYVQRLPVGETGIHTLHRASAGDAFHDSADRYPQPKCHPETRQGILDDLWNWTSKINPDSIVLWLYGPAGAGKSAIAQSFCQNLELDGRLGGSFFFKRGHSSRGNAKRLFATIAYQLARRKESPHPDLRRVILEKIEEDPSILDRSLSRQLQELISEPCRQNPGGGNLVIVIDGLDECEGHGAQQEILRAIGDNIRDPLPLRILIASRPEPHIGEMFRAPSLERVHRPFNILQANDDVRRYLKDEFRRIHRDHYDTMSTVWTPWPVSEIIEKLVAKSSGYFIYASTVIKFIDDKNFRPTDRLEIIMGFAEVEPEFGSPFAALDQLYTQILSSVPRRAQLLKILMVMFAPFRLRIGHIEQLLGLKFGDVRLALRGLHSLIEIAEPPVDELVAYHASLHDFLHDPTRSGPFYIGDSQHREDLAVHIIKAFSYRNANPSLNSREHVSRTLGLAGFQYIARTKPSPILAGFLQSFNPEFLFLFSSAAVEKPWDLILNWLKRIRPLPAELIQRWEDYSFMIFCDYIWARPTYSTFGYGQGWQNRPENALLAASPALIRILHLYAFTMGVIDVFESSVCVSHIRALLDFTWEELRTVIRPLHTTIGRDREAIRYLLVSATSPVFFRKFDARSTLEILIRSSMTIMKMPGSSLGQSRSFSYFLRSHPPSANLLRDLNQLLTFHELHLDDLFFSNIIEWLQGFPQPPVELIVFCQMRTARLRRNEDHWRQYKEHHLRRGYFSTL